MAKREGAARTGSRAPACFGDGAVRGGAIDGDGSSTIRLYSCTLSGNHATNDGGGIEETTGTLLCGDLFTQPGRGEPALTGADILGPSEAFRQPMDYFAHCPQTGALLEKLAQAQPTTLACMHGSAWRGDGAGLLRALAGALGH